MKYLAPRWTTVFVDVLIQEHTAFFVLENPQDRLEAFAERANCLLDFTAPEEQLAVFERLEAVVHATEGFSRTLSPGHP